MIKTGCQERWYATMIADYCWLLKSNYLRSVRLRIDINATKNKRILHETKTETFPIFQCLWQVDI